MSPPSTHQSGDSGESVSWERKIATEFDEMTAVACVRGIRSEERARRVLGLVNEHGVRDGRRECVVEKVRELSD
jgi:hypothetical protein